MEDGDLDVLIARLKPALEASLDCVAIVDGLNRIAFANLAMKNLLGLKGRELKRRPVFCELLTLPGCQPECQILELLRTGETVQLDEVPCAMGAKKLRATLKGVPLYFSEQHAVRRAPIDTPIGAILTLRDSTGEILLSAKYRKSIEIIRTRDARLAELEAYVTYLNDAAKRGKRP